LIYNRLHIGAQAKTRVSTEHLPAEKLCLCKRGKLKFCWDSLAPLSEALMVGRLIPVAALLLPASRMWVWTRKRGPVSQKHEARVECFSEEEICLDFGGARFCYRFRVSPLCFNSRGSGSGVMVANEKRGNLAEVMHREGSGNRVEDK
jgi:hypothetical protein